MVGLNESILTLVIFSPLIGVILILLLKQNQTTAIKAVGLGTSVLTFIFSLHLYFYFDSTTAAMQFVARAPWIPSLNISYAVGVDGISLLLVLLTTFLTPLALLASWDSITKKVRHFVLFMLLLEVGMLGVFCAIDMFLFYVFWEAMLIPMYFIIGVWGGQERIYAAVKFFLYTMVGSLLMLVAILWLGYTAAATSLSHFTTDYTELLTVGPNIPTGIQTWMFLAFALSFAIKVPLFPFHTWLPDAHVQAPTAGSVILAGVLLKMGTYGLLRFCIPLFPAASATMAPYISVLAVIGILYGALVSMVQTDIKKLVAYSSVSHLGFVVLGIFALTEVSVQGSVIQMVNHGLSTGALFLLVGMIYDRRHTRSISDFGGLVKVMPVFAFFFMLVSLSSIGLPGLNGFVGEFLILLGSFSSPLLGSFWFTILAVMGVIFAAVYMLWAYQRMFFGECTNPDNQSLVDLTKREMAVLVPIVLFIVWIGVYPSTFLNTSAASVRNTVRQMQERSEGKMTSQAQSYRSQRTEVEK
jgi:NADH-quinone oxidoreductase subunit M